jgi:tetratricopeptide (TPR) repeat protein
VRLNHQVVIFIDEIDAVRSLPFSSDEFFAAIRDCHNRRAEDSRLEQLVFCLLGVATPSDLIRDTRTTPFNIGQRIELRDFSEEEVAQLSKGLGRGSEINKVLLKRAMYWTDGHPYLTQRLCKSIAEDSDVANAGSVDSLCKELFISAGNRERDDHLSFVSKNILNSQGVDRVSLLDLYKKIHSQKLVVSDDSSQLVGALKLSGIVKIIKGQLYVRNRIYYHGLDSKWITANMPDAEMRRQRAAYKRGVWRTTAIAAGILVIMGMLVGMVVQQRKKAAKRLNETVVILSSFLNLNDLIKGVPNSMEERKRQIRFVIESLDDAAREASRDVRLQREIAIAYQQIGDIQGNPFDSNLGDRDGARDSYQKAMMIRDGLVRQNPLSVEDRRGLAVVHVRIGALAFATGQTQIAIDNCRKGIAIAEGLAESGQLDPQTSHMLPDGYLSLAYALSRNGNAEGALDIILSGQIMFGKLVLAYPYDSQIKYDQLTILSTIGDSYVDLHKYPEALNIFHEVLPIDEERSAAAQNNISDKIAVAVDYMKIGNTQLLNNNSKAASGSFRKMLTVIEQAAACDQKNVRAKTLVAIAQVRLGRVLCKHGNYAEGLTYLQRAAPFFTKTAKDNPDSPYAQIQMAYTDMQISVALSRTGKSKQALELAESARAIADNRVAADPSSIEFRGIQAGIYLMFGDIYSALTTGEHDPSNRSNFWRLARGWYQRSYDILKDQYGRGQQPDREYGTPDELKTKISLCDAALARLKITR